MSESDRSDRPERRRIASGVWLLVMAAVALGAYTLGRSGWPEWPDTSNTVLVEPAAEPSVGETTLDAVATTATLMVATTTTPATAGAEDAEMANAVDQLEAQEQA